MTGSQGEGPPTAPAWKDIDAHEAMTLAVGWRSGNKMKLGRLSMSPDVKDALSEIADAYLIDLADREPEAWAPDADLTDETYLLLPREEAGAGPVLARDVEDHSTLLDALAAAAGLPLLGPDDLPAPELALYAMVVGDDPMERVVFLRRSNPRRALRKGRIFTSYADVLSRIEAPLFGFDDLVDLIAVGEQVAVLSQTAFMALFRDNQALTAQVPAWVADIGARLPLADGSEEVLAEKAQRDSRIRMRLEAVARRGHLSTVTSDEVRTLMLDNGLDADELMNAEGELIITEATAGLVLQVLNEDLYLGGLSSTSFRADKKSAR